MRAWTRWAALAGLLLCLAGCRPAKPRVAGATAAKPIRIGAIFPLSGGAGRIGEMKRQGADLAVEHLNAAGGVNNRPLEILYADSRNSATEAGVAFSKLVDVDQVPLVMSAMSQVSLALVAPADRKQVVLYANASYPGLTRKSPFVFRNLPSTEQTTTAMAQAAYRDLDVRKVVVLYLNDEYGAEAARLFRQRLESLGGKVLAAEPFERQGTDFRATLAKLGRLQPDAWWIPGYGAALGLVLKQKAELHLPGFALCDLGLVDTNVLRTAGGAADRAVVVAPAFDPADPRPAVQRFVKDFGTKYHELPSFDAAFQYDAVFLIADAMKRAGALTGPDLAAALAQTKDFLGVCGPTSFDTDREAQLKVVVRMMVDGRLQPLEKVTQAAPTKPATSRRPTDESSPE